MVSLKKILFSGVAFAVASSLFVSSHAKEGSLRRLSGQRGDGTQGGGGQNGDRADNYLASIAFPGNLACPGDPTSGCSRTDQGEVQDFENLFSLRPGSGARGDFSLEVVTGQPLIARASGFTAGAPDGIVISILIETLHSEIGSFVIFGTLDPTLTDETSQVISAVGLNIDAAGIPVVQIGDGYTIVNVAFVP